MEVADKPDSVAVEKEPACSMIIQRGDYKPRHSFQEAGHQGAEVGLGMKGQDCFTSPEGTGAKDRETLQVTSLLSGC